MVQAGRCRPHELKALTNHRDFGDEEPAIQGVMRSIRFSLWTVVLCTQEFVDRDLETLSAAIAELHDDVRLWPHSAAAGFYHSVFHCFSVDDF